MWDTTGQFKFFDTFMLAFTGFLGVVGSLTLVVGGIGVSNIMNVVVEERTKEIGIKMALGAKQRFILGQFLLETLLVTGIGGAIGFAVSLSDLRRLPEVRPHGVRRGARGVAGRRGDHDRHPRAHRPRRRVVPGAGGVAAGPGRGDEALMRTPAVVLTLFTQSSRLAKKRAYAHDRRDRVGHRRDPPPPLLRRGTQAPDGPQPPLDGREPRRHVAERDVEAVEGDAARPRDPPHDGRRRLRRGPHARARRRHRRESRRGGPRSRTGARP